MVVVWKLQDRPEVVVSWAEMRREVREGSKTWQSF